MAAPIILSVILFNRSSSVIRANLSERREDFPSLTYYLCVLRVQKSLNTEVTEFLRVLCVKS